ncbi:MAG: hypothetical protein UY90_C0075G0004 [Candidatus Peregrinibacteria bacterium GW2011_GWA2_54_9]|nr:MAG: hypothetical protein UY90_C0075G0004 [Candidatus Peregrinibacteria bacterium GW2011_GWA2_54_9]
MECRSTVSSSISCILHGGDEIEERTVVVGMESDTDVEVISGVEEGEKVVILIKE